MGSRRIDLGCVYTSKCPDLSIWVVDLWSKTSEMYCLWNKNSIMEIMDMISVARLESGAVEHVWCIEMNLLDHGSIYNNMLSMNTLEQGSENIEQCPEAREHTWSFKWQKLYIGMPQTLASAIGFMIHWWNKRWWHNPVKVHDIGIPWTLFSAIGSVAWRLINFAWDISYASAILACLGP